MNSYGADIKPSIEARARGFPISLYLDSATQRYIEEFNVSNFIGISADRSTFVTPDSNTVLPSITNQMLQQIAEEMGMRIERRPIEIDECANFSEVAGCGTAVSGNLSNLPQYSQLLPTPYQRHRRSPNL